MLKPLDGSGKLMAYTVKKKARLQNGKKEHFKVSVPYFLVGISFDTF